MEAPLQLAAQARRRIDQVRKQLLSPTPEIFAACGAPLNEAIVYMEKLQSYLRGSQSPMAGNSLRKEIISLRIELAQTSALLEAAGQFYEGYGRLLGQGAEVPPVNYGLHTAPSSGEAVPSLVIHG